MLLWIYNSSCHLTFIEIFLYLFFFNSDFYNLSYTAAAPSLLLLVHPCTVLMEELCAFYFRKQTGKQKKKFVPLKYICEILP